MKILLCIMGVLFAVVANAQVTLTVNNQSKVYPDFKAANAAAKSAAANSTIIMRLGSGAHNVEGEKIERSMTIVGTGYNSNFGYTSILNGNFSILSNNVRLEALEISNTLTLGASSGLDFNNVSLRKVKVSDVQINKVQNVKIEECIITNRFVSLTYASFVKNTLINHVASGTTTKYVNFDQCVFYGKNGNSISSVLNSTFTNCFFLNAVSNHPTYNNTFQKCAFRNGVSNVSIPTIGSVFFDDPNAVFEKIQVPNQWTEGDSYKIKDSFTNKNSGIGGTELGVFGGSGFDEKGKSALMPDFKIVIVKKVVNNVLQIRYILVR